MTTYNPRTRRTWEASPQLEPDRFDNDALKAEVRYLRSLNKRYGEATLRTLAIVRLCNVLAARQAVQS